MLIWSHPNGAHLRTNDGIVRAHEIPTVTGVLGLLENVRTECAAIRQEALDEARNTAEAAERSAESLLQAARDAAQAMVEQAREEAAAEREQGHDHGEREAAARWHGRFAQLKATHEDAWHAMDTKLAGVVALAVERIVHSASREALFQRALLTVKDALRQAGTAVLRVHPDEAPAAHTAIAAAAAGPNEPQVRIETDASLEPGTCIFESDMGRLDTSLHVQLAGVRSALERATRLAMANASPEASAAPDPEELEFDFAEQDEPPMAEEYDELPELDVPQEADSTQEDEGPWPDEPQGPMSRTEPETDLDPDPDLDLEAEATPATWFSSVVPMDGDTTDWFESLDPMNTPVHDDEEMHHA
ncbi:type III secretion system stator protein SctL [Paracidovorax valerianellae]|uniref:Flagellar assembly protein FliH n=1 Tax=Paracidovorax valerianellae TaxID=187868 RepID=A0A1G7B4I1_9BURK|nr:type III secretion system stator protein SctL [Paracidovorax valerianellae]MDA8445692.1 type III secretion system stator protein SctL [Paracidovorax valerianellae]SDE21135.1 type III secretion protein L [Paracidovorax valerianellae]